MAKETATDPLFLGSDFQYPFHIKNEAEDAAIDITGWALSWMLKRSIDDPDSKAHVTKTTSAGINIAGQYAASPVSNLQRATVTLDDLDTASLAAGPCHYELKRTDAGFETVLAYGALTLVRGVHRA